MYINEFSNNNITYSIDMIRLKTYLTYSVFTEIEFRFKTCWKNFIKKYYTTPQQKQFFYNYVIEVGEGQSFWFGYCHNTERRSFYENAQYNFTIEFNPNKLKDNKIIMYLLNLSGKWYLKSYDLAMDLKISILDLITDMSNKRKIYIMSYGFDNKTIAAGKGDGRAKIYNKKAESNLDIQGELTRVEISREYEDMPINDIKFFKYDNNFPIIYLNNYLYSFNDYNDKTLFAILYAVQNGFPVKDLSRSYKNKIKNLLEGGHKIRFDNKTAGDVLRKTIFYYFMKNPLIRWG